MGKAGNAPHAIRMNPAFVTTEHLPGEIREAIDWIGEIRDEAKARREEILAIFAEHGDRLKHARKVHLQREVPKLLAIETDAARILAAINQVQEGTVQDGQTSGPEACTADHRGTGEADSEGVRIGSADIGIGPEVSDEPGPDQGGDH